MVENQILLNLIIQKLQKINEKMDLTYYGIYIQYGNCYHQLPMHRILDSEVVRASFKEEALHKQIFIQKLGYDLQEKLQSAIDLSNSSIAQVVHCIRKILDSLSTVFDDIIGYFTELQLEFAFELIFSSFKLSNSCFKGLSGLFLGILRTRERAEELEEKEKLSQKCESQFFTSKGQKLQWDYFENLFKQMQEQEMRIMKEKEMAEHHFLYERQSIIKVNPSQAVHELQELDTHIQKMIENSQRISDENYLFRHQELSKHMLTLKKPDELTAILDATLTVNGNKKIATAINRIIKILSENLRGKEKQRLLDEIKSSIIRIDEQVQVQEQKNRSDNRGRGSDGEGPKSITTLKQQVATITKELQDTKDALKNQEQKGAAMEKMLMKKMIQIQQLTVQFNYQVSKKDSYITTLKERNSSLKKANEINQQPDQQPENEIDLSKTLSREKSICERQKKQYFLTKKYLKSLITRLQAKLKIKISSDQELENDVAAGLIEIKIQEIQTSIQSMQKKKKKNVIRSLDEPRIPDKLISVSTQTQRAFPVPSKIYDQFKQPKKFVQNPRHQTKAMNQSDRLEHLKDQLMKRVNRSQKKNPANRTISAVRGNQQISLIFDMEQGALGQKTEQPLPLTAKPIFNRKDISFEQIKIARNSQLMKKTTKAKRSARIEKQVILTQTKENDQSLLQGSSADKEVGKVIKFLQAKNNGNPKNTFYSNFLQQLLEEVKNRKGMNFMMDILKPVAKAQLSDFLTHRKSRFS